MDQVSFRPGPPRLLHPDLQTVEKFRQLGLQGASYRVCGKAVGVSKDTIANFLYRHSHVKAVYQAALGEYRASVLLAKMAEKAAAREERPAPRAPRTGRPRAGETCPTCGHRADQDDEAIVLTPATIAEAQRKLDEILARNLSARDTGANQE